MVKLLSRYIFLALIIASCGKSIKYPEWYLTPPANDSKYLYGVGEGFDPEEAKQSALSDASGRLRTIISSKFTSAYEEDDVGKSSSISQKITSQIEKTAFNNYTVLKSQKVQDGNTFVSMIGIDTQKLIQGYKTELYSAFDMMRKFESSSSSGILEKRNNIAKAVTIGMQNEAKIKIIESIDPSYDAKSDLEFMNTFNQKLTEINAKIHFSVDSPNADITSVINYGLNKMNIGVSDQTSSDQYNVKIKISEKWITKFAMESYMAKLILNISIIDSSNKTIATSVSEVSGASFSNEEMAKKMAVSKIKEQIDQKGVMEFLKINK